ncbi:MAG: outer membrane beta-barrel family protein [Tannerellaceae bacterium]|jgi:hypothetical protein|nr:outer membrane beta-barrel family protein [Tannerellaceae bacterium]
MKATFFFLALALLPCLANTRQAQKIAGKVTDSNHSPIESGYNILLLSPQDSSIYKGDFFLTPDFSIETGQFPVLLKVTSFGYRDTILSVPSPAGGLLDIRLSVQSYRLNEVTVKAFQPMFSMRNDRITLNVAGTALSESGSAIDVLQKAARVKVDENGISVLGAGNALIVVDGREAPNNQALEMLSSSEIQRIDIITNPSSNYDAKGKAVIEIHTRKAQNQGFGAEVTGRMSKGAYRNLYTGTILSAKTSRLSLYGSYIFYTNKKYNTESYARDYTRETPPVYGLIDRESIDNTTENHRIRLSGDYSFSDKHKAGLQLSGQFSDGNNATDEISRTYNSAGTHLPPLTELMSVQQTSLNRNFLTGTAFYSYQSSPTGINMNSVFDKSYYDTKLNTQIRELGYTGIASKENDLSTAIDITSFKTDVSIPLPESFTLETGIKYSNIRNRSNTFFSSEGTAVRNIAYDYKENSGALYFNLSKQWGKLNTELGARVEVSGNYATTDRVVQDTATWHVFPSLQLNYGIDGNWDAGFSYAMKISRPTFQDLNPAIEYIDSQTYFQGNPALVPEIRHALALKLSYMKMASLGVNYARMNNLLAWYIEQDPANPLLTRITQKNIDKSDMLSIDAMLPYQNNWLSCYLSTGLLYAISHDRALGTVDLKQPMWYAYSGFDFALPYGFKLNATIRYFTKGLENVFYFDPVFRMDAGILKSFLNNKLTATILWNDLFKTDGMNTYSTINNRYIGYQYYFDRSVISLSLVYRFSSQKSRYQSRSSINPESERIKGLDKH